MENLVGLLASNNNLGMDPFGHPSAYGALAHCRVGQNTQIKKAVLQIPVRASWHGPLADFFQQTGPVLVREAV